MNAPLPISGVVIARNEADRIGRCVASLASICTDVIVLDSCSEDATAAIATVAGARVEQQPWLGFSAQKNAAIARASQPWVLLLDADEWLGADDLPKLRALFADGAVEHADVWRLPRRTHYLGTALEHGGWGREWVERLFRPDLRYQPAEVHEKLDLRDRRIAKVDVRIEHDTARSQVEYAAKMQRYAQLWAQQRHAAGKRAGPWSAPLHASAHWLKNYLLRGGFRDGAMARQFHGMHVHYVYDKYRLLHAAGRSDAADGAAP